jgi:hypothetical protein
LFIEITFEFLNLFNVKDAKGKEIVAKPDFFGGGEGDWGGGGCNFLKILKNPFNICV